MGKKKTIPLPNYEELKENTYNTANRIMTGNLGDWLLSNYETIGTVSPDQQQRYSDIANTAMAASWDDFNRQLAKGQSAAKARTYNRFGSLTNTPALYDQETFAKQANTEATDLANATAKYYNSLVNQDINRQLQAWQQYSNMYNKAGEDITTLDKYNWNIRNQNKDRAYTNDITKFNKFKQQLNEWSNLIKPTSSFINDLDISGLGSNINQWFRNNWTNGKMFDSNAIDSSFMLA